MLSEKYQRLNGVDVLHYSWFAQSNAEIAISDLMVVTDDAKKTRFLCRVTDIIHQDGDLLVMASPIGYIGPDNEFRRPRIIPSLNAFVRPIEEDDNEIMRRFMGDLSIGLMMSGIRPLHDLPVKLPAEIIRQHMGVFATTGMGKSNFMKVFCGSVIQSTPFGLLISDPHGEYATGLSTDPESRGLMHHPDADDGLAVYSILNGGEREISGMKPLHISYDDVSIDDLGLVFDHSRAEGEVINLLTPFSGKDIFDFFLTEDVESLPSSFRITSYIGDHQEIASRIRSGEPDALRTIQREINTLIDLCREFISGEESSIPEIIADLKDNKVVLIDIPGRSEAAELFLMATISRAILKTYKADIIQPRQTVGGSNVLIALEEAQRVLSDRNNRTGIFREIAMEGRKFGVGICAITQQPKNIDARILAQMNTFVIMGLADQKDREIIMSSAKHDLRILDTEIQTLDRGDAIISTIGIPFPVSCHINRFEDTL